MSSNLGDPPVMDVDRRFSVHVSRALDCMGKNQDMVKYRVDQYKQWGQHLAGIYNDCAEHIISGSKGEGLTSYFESDLDIMFVYNEVLCADDTSSLRHIRCVSMFETNRLDTSPGYTKLRLCRFEGTNTSIIKVLGLLVKGENGQLYLSSDCFIEQLRNSINKDFSYQFLYRSGPSQPFLDPFACSQDLVGAYRCICPEITQSFNTRPRDYGWPSSDQLAEISTFDGHVVPVGYKGSATACLEWRICYTKAERFLMCSLNDTQTKLYILLKMVAKTYLNSTSKEITSYVLKNIVLWLAECCDIETFKEELLIDRIFQALGFLRKCIINNNLPSYMIPERNLFSEKLDLVQRQKLVILLTKLFQVGGGLLMGCQRLYNTMIVLYKEPARAEQYRWKRDMIEKLVIRQKNKVNESMSFCGAYNRPQAMLLFTDDQNLERHFALLCLVIPDLLQNDLDLDFSYIFIERLKQWLS